MGKRVREHANIQCILFSHDLFLFAFLLLSAAVSPDALQQFLFITSDFQILSFLPFLKKSFLLSLSGLHFSYCTSFWYLKHLFHPTVLVSHFGIDSHPISSVEMWLKLYFSPFLNNRNPSKSDVTTKPH